MRRLVELLTAKVVDLSDRFGVVERAQTVNGDTRRV